MTASTVQRVWLLLIATLRVATMLGAALALALLAVIVWAPATLDAWGDRQRRDFELRWFEQWQALTQLAATDPAAARALAGELSQELRAVHKLDRLATMVRLVEGMRHSLAMRAGDAVEAITSAQRLVGLDDRDIDAVVALGEALASDGDRCHAAIAVLEPVAHAVPTHPRLVALLAELHLAAGDANAAANVLVHAEVERKEPAWSVQWGNDARQATWCVPHRAGATTVAVNFAVVEATEQVSLRIEPASALLLSNPVLCVQRDGATTTAPLAEMPHRLDHARFAGEHLIVDGDVRATIDLIALPRSEQATTFTLTAGYRALPPRWLRDLVLGPVGERVDRMADGTGRVALQRLRRDAFRACLLTVQASSAAAQHRPMMVALQADGDDFVAQFTLPASVGDFEILLPARLRVRYGKLALLRGDTQCGTAATWKDLERGDGGSVTGPTPKLCFSMPPAFEPRTLTLRGSIQ